MLYTEHGVDEAGPSADGSQADVQPQEDRSGARDRPCDVRSTQRAQCAGRPDHPDRPVHADGDPQTHKIGAKEKRRRGESADDDGKPSCGAFLPAVPLEGDEEVQRGGLEEQCVLLRIVSTLAEPDEVEQEDNDGDRRGDDTEMASQPDEDEQGRTKQEQCLDSPDSPYVSAGDEQAGQVDRIEQRSLVIPSIQVGHLAMQHALRHMDEHAGVSERRHHERRERKEQEHRGGGRPGDGERCGQRRTGPGSHAIDTTNERGTRDRMVHHLPGSREPCFGMPTPIGPVQQGRRLLRRRFTMRRRFRAGAGLARRRWRRTGRASRRAAARSSTSRSREGRPDGTLRPVTRGR